MNKKIIITGGNGFIGSHLVKEIIQNKSQPILLLRKKSDLRRLKDVKGFKSFVVSSYLDNELIMKLKNLNASSFIHCAWSGVLAKDRNNAIQRDNLKLTVESVKLANKVGCRRWTGLGSHAEYGNPNRKTNELDETKPTTLYGKLKLKSCRQSLSLCKQLGMRGSWIRIYDTYGPNDNESWLIPYVITTLLKNKKPKLTSGEQFWDFLHIKDAVKAIIKINDSDNTGIYNLGSDEPKKLKDIVSIICKEMNSKIKPTFGKLPYRNDQIMKLHPDITKIKKDIGWHPNINFRSGIKNLINYYNEN